MTNTPKQAIAAARDQSGSNNRFGVGLCLQRVRICYGIPAKYPDATAAWRNARYKHTKGTPPRGSLVFWTGGSSGHGHIAISTGDGSVWSTDIVRPGYFDRVPIARIHERWGMTYAGYTEDVNGVRVIKLPRNTRWARVRSALLATLSSPDAQAISAKRLHVRAFLAATRTALAALPKD